MSSTADPSTTHTQALQASTAAMPNVIASRDPDLFQRLGAFGAAVNTMLLDKLASQVLQEPAVRLKDCPHPLPDVKATALLLRMLTKESWDRDDITLLDALWRQATATELFGLEFEGERHRIEQCVDASRRKLGKEKPQALLW